MNLQSWCDFEQQEAASKDTIDIKRVYIMMTLNEKDHPQSNHRRLLKMKICKWCGKEAKRLNKDSICSECNNARHGEYLINLTKTKDFEDYYKQEEQKIKKLCEKLFPLPKPEEYPPVAVRILNPMWLVQGLRNGTIQEYPIQMGLN